MKSFLTFTLFLLTPFLTFLSAEAKRTCSHPLMTEEGSLSRFSPYYRHKMQTPNFKKKRRKYLFKAFNDYQNQIHVFQNPMESFTAKIEALMKAKESIHIQYLELKGDESNALISEILKIKAREGVNVQIIVDAIHMFYKCKPSTPCFDLLRDLLENPKIGVYGVGETNFKQIANELNYKPFSLNKRLHEKSIIIDGFNEKTGFAITGGSNIANKFAQASTFSKLKWWDQDLLVKGPIIKQIQQSYIWNLAYYSSQKDKWWKGLRPSLNRGKKNWHLMWNEKWGPIHGKQTVDLSHEITNLLKSEKSFGTVLKSQNKKNVDRAKEILNKNRKGIENYEMTKSPMRYFQHRPKAKEMIIHDLYLQMINESKEEIIIANSYMILSDSMKVALRKAVRRGVKVHLISNSKKSTDSKQTVMFFKLQQYGLLKLNREKRVKEKGGEIKIYTWKGNEIGLGTMHSKVAVFDKRDAFIGSFNFDYRSKLFNTENGLLFHGDAAEKTHQIMQEEYLTRVNPVTIQEAKSYLHNHSLKEKAEILFWSPFKYLF